jgi:hypothetical protein
MRSPVGAQLLREIEAVLASQVDVDERHVRPEHFDQPERLGAVRRDADDVHSFLLQERAGGLEERPAVVDDEASQKHFLSIAEQSPGCIPATGNPGYRPGSAWQVASHTWKTPCRLVAGAVREAVLDDAAEDGSGLGITLDVPVEVPETNHLSGAAAR